MYIIICSGDGIPHIIGITPRLEGLLASTTLQAVHCAIGFSKNKTKFLAIKRLKLMKNSKL